MSSFVCDSQRVAAAMITSIELGRTWLAEGGYTLLMVSTGTATVPVWGDPRRKAPRVIFAIAELV